MKRCFSSLFLFCVLLTTTSCSPSKREVPILDPELRKPMSTEQSKRVLGEVGKNWLYGQGVGETAATIGTIAVFPPSAFVFLGNAALGLSGYEPIRVGDFLPEDAAEVWDAGYGSITSAPGRTIAAIGREEYRDQEVASERIKGVLEEPTSQRASLTTTAQ